MYVKIKNGSIEKFPYSLGDLRSENPQTSFPRSLTDEQFAEWGVYPVSVTTAPSYNEATQNLSQSEEPSLVNGNWEMTWNVAEKTDEEIQEYNQGIANGNRSNRDFLLGTTDFYALSDVTMSDEMKSYRQLLRDLTTHKNWPHLEDSDWPTKPE
jgi:hypothetical protein